MKRYLVAAGPEDLTIIDPRTNCISEHRRLIIVLFSIIFPLMSIELGLLQRSLPS